MSDSISNGPVASAVKGEASKTKGEFSDLAASRQTPSTPAATGQPLTHYHSFFSDLLSWNNPRASGIAYASIVTFIFAVRYLDLIRWGLKLTYISLAVTVAAEIAGKLVMSKGLTSQLRPAKYYTLPRETFDNIFGDVHELLNFFVIESQRIVFAENVYASAAAFVAAFLSYFLVKIVPYWGLALIGTTVLFVAPLIYKTNKELIDNQVKQASDIVNAQTNQLRELAGKHTANATNVTKQYMGDYTAKAQSMLGGRATPITTPASAVKTAPAAPTTEPVKSYEATDFPAAPKAEISTEEPLIST